jgi:D,D-heptose 1,7-bisphosphate phosphatase
MPERQKKRRAILLDRDGTVIVDKDYLSDPAEVELLPGAAAALARLSQAGFALVLISNQSGVARGRFGLAEVDAVNERLRELLAARGVVIDGMYFCPHHPEGVVEEYRQTCRCRKPEPGMALRARDELGLDLAGSYVVGDKLSDLDLAVAIGAKGLLTLTGYGRESLRKRPAAPQAENLAEAARIILADEE